MDSYLLIKWLHILSSTVLFGTGIGTAFHMWMAHRRGTAGEIALAARHTVLADWLFTLPAGLVQPITGFAMVWAADWSPWEPWMVISYGLFVLALAAWVPVVMIQITVADLAREAASAEADLPRRYHDLMRIWFWLGWPAFLSLVAIFWLMVAKPDLW